MTVKAKEQQFEAVSIPPMSQSVLHVRVGGDRMLHNCITPGAIAQIKGEAGAKNKEDYKTKASRWKETAHIDPQGRLGFPAESFLKAMSTVLKGVELSKKKLFKYPKDLFRAMHIETDSVNQHGDGIVLYQKGEPEMYEHLAVLRGQTPIPVYRTLVKNWEMNLRIVYDDTLLSPQDILLLVNRAGSGVGVGAWRPENRGTFGLFEVLGAQVLKKK